MLSLEVRSVKTKYWIWLLVGVVVICLALSALLFAGGDADFAQVYSDGKLLYTLDLRIDQQKTVQSEYGINVITVRDSEIAVTQADCPDGYCMKRGFCSGGAQIVCLPNRLVIRFCGLEEIDGAVG